jgi:hypothetical protein
MKKLNSDSIITLKKSCLSFVLRHYLFKNEPFLLLARVCLHNYLGGLRADINFFNLQKFQFHILSIQLQLIIVAFDNQRLTYLAFIHYN